MISFSSCSWLLYQILWLMLSPSILYLVWCMSSIATATSSSAAIIPPLDAVVPEHLAHERRVLALRKHLAVRAVVRAATRKSQGPGGGGDGGGGAPVSALQLVQRRARRAGRAALSRLSRIICAPQKAS